MTIFTDRLKASRWITVNESGEVRGTLRLWWVLFAIDILTITAMLISAIVCTFRRDYSGVAWAVGVGAFNVCILCDFLQRKPK